MSGVGLTGTPDLRFTGTILSLAQQESGPQHVGEVDFNIEVDSAGGCTVVAVGDGVVEAPMPPVGAAAAKLQSSADRVLSSQTSVQITQRLP